MPVIVTADRAVASVTATESEDWQVVSTPTGFAGITSANFADNDKVAGFVIFENGEDWEVYDTEDDTDTTLLEITNISGTVTISRPATPYASSNSGDQVNAGSGTHTLVVGMGAGTAKRLLRETNPSVKTFTSADPTPSVADYRFFKTNGSTTITAFDDMEGGKLFVIRRGDSDITIADGAGISLPNDEDISLTVAQPSAIFMEDTGVAYLIGRTGSEVLDEDDFSSDSPTKPPSQQSVGAYVAKAPNVAVATELTLSSGAITPTLASHTVDTESDSASDDLDTITATNFSAGHLLFLSAADASRTIVVKDGTGNINLPLGADISLDDDEKTVALRYDGSGWNYVAGASSSTEVSISFDTRAQAVAGSTGVAQFIRVGDLDYVYDASGDALTTGDSRTWSPTRTKITPQHWAENTTPGTTDMLTAINTALLYASGLVDAYHADEDQFFTQRVRVDCLGEIMGISDSVEMHNLSGVELHNFGFVPIGGGWATSDYAIELKDDPGTGVSVSCRIEKGFIDCGRTCSGIHISKTRQCSVRDIILSRVALVGVKAEEKNTELRLEDIYANEYEFGETGYDDYAQQNATLFDISTADVIIEGCVGAGSALALKTTGGPIQINNSHFYAPDLTALSVGSNEVFVADLEFDGQILTNVYFDNGAVLVRGSGPNDGKIVFAGCKFHHKGSSPATDALVFESQTVGWDMADVIFAGGEITGGKGASFQTTGSGTWASVLKQTIAGLVGNSGKSAPGLPIFSIRDHLVVNESDGSVTAGVKLTTPYVVAQEDLNTKKVFLSAGAPTAQFNETDGPTDEKIYRFVGRNGNFVWEAANDADDAAAAIMSVEKTGTTIDAARWVVPMYFDNAVISASNLPTSDPAVSGELWVDTSASNVVKVSA